MSKIRAYFVKHDEEFICPDKVTVGFSVRDLVTAQLEEALAFLIDKGATDEDIARVRAELNDEQYAEFGRYWIAADDVEPGYLQG